MALIMEIMKTIARPISELAVWLEDNYQIEKSETVAKWRELTGMNITITEDEVSHDEVQSLDVDSTKRNKTKKIPRTKDVCQHIFMSGQKVGEQCTTKPKNGASHCSAHKPKDSVKSSKGTKAPKKKEVKKVETIDSEFGSDSEIESSVKAVSEPKEVKKSKEVKKPKKSKKEKDEKEPLKKEKTTKEDTEPEDSDDGELKAQKQLVEDSEDENLSEPQKPVKPLLKKKNLTNGHVKPKSTKKVYDTDEEALDKNLDLTDDE
jgi:hypothetical protein